MKANYLASPPLVVAYALAGRMDIDFETTEPIDGETSTCATSGRAREEIGDTIASSVRAEQFAETYADVFTGDDDVARAAGSRGRALRLGAGLDVRAAAAVLRRDVARAGHGRRHRRRALPRVARRLGHDRPHLAGRLDQAGLARGRVPRRARRRAQGLQLVRRPARQPRGDGARHVRERAAAQPARARVARERGRCTCRRARR